MKKNSKGKVLNRRFEITQIKEGMEAKMSSVSKSSSSSVNGLKKRWILDWDCVKFKSGYIVVYPPKNGVVKFTPKAIPLQGSLESFNYLKEYIKIKLSPIYCEVEAMNLDVFDKIRLNEAIQKFTTASKQVVIDAQGEIVKKDTPSTESFQQALSKASQMTPEEFKKYKSQYIDFLIDLQCEEYKVIPCVERLAHANNDSTEYAFMFSINCKSGDVLIVHENVNPDRSTLLFIVRKRKYDNTIKSIYDFLQSEVINKRSSIREGAIKHGDGIIDYKSINHDDINSWQKVIRECINIKDRIPRQEDNIMKLRYNSLSRLLREVQSKDNFIKVEPIFAQYGIPLTRRVKPADILARIPDTCFITDKNGNRTIPIQKGTWSLEKMLKLIK